MKAYEEWYKENMYDRTETEKAWRAALEWVLVEYSMDKDEAYKHFPYIKEELGQ